MVSVPLDSNSFPNRFFGSWKPLPAVNRSAAPTPVRGTGVDAPPEAFLLKKPEAVWLGEDLLLEYEVSGQDE